MLKIIQVKNSIQIKMIVKRSKFFYAILFCFLIQFNPSYSQNNALLQQNRIDSCFKILNSIHPAIDKKYNQQIRYFPFYERFDVQIQNQREKIMSEGTCKEYYISYKMRLLLEIYLFVYNEDTSHIYNLIDSGNNILYDLVTYNCSGMKKNLWSVDTINQEAFSEVYDSYQKWNKLILSKDMKNGYEKKILPTSFSTYKWQKEIGYFQDFVDNKGIFEAAKLILSDNDYMNYFIEKEQLKYFFNKIENIEIISELALLALVNNQTSFTPNVLKFKLKFEKSSNSGTMSSYELLQDLMQKESNDFNSIDILGFLTKNKVVISLNN
jgi:hypothetical protein